MAGGRPLLFDNVEELERRIAEYFESCHEELWAKDEDGKWFPILDREGKVVKKLIRPYTITGLAVHLDTSRTTLLNYEERPEFFSTIKRAKEKIENFAEEQLYTSNHTAGVIFNLLNNHQWTNKQEVDMSVKEMPEITIKRGKD